MAADPKAFIAKLEIGDEFCGICGKPGVGKLYHRLSPCDCVHEVDVHKGKRASRLGVQFT